MGNNWIEWNGGECPVPKGTLVDVKYRGGATKYSLPALEDVPRDSGLNARNCFWVHDAHQQDIIAYRLHQPEQAAWNGEGLPPEGIECEVKSGKYSWTLCKVVHSSSAGVAFIYLEEPMGETSRSRYIGVLDSAPRESAMIYFRPLRTEAERKRDEATIAMHKIWHSVAGQETDGDLISIYDCLYNAIAAGKIPGVKLD